MVAITAHWRVLTIVPLCLVKDLVYARFVKDVCCTGRPDCIFRDGLLRRVVVGVKLELFDMGEESDRLKVKCSEISVCSVSAPGGVDCVLGKAQLFDCSVEDVCTVLCPWKPMLASLIS